MPRRSKPQGTTIKSKKKRPAKKKRSQRMKSKDSGLSYSNNLVTKSDVIGGKYYEVQKRLSNQFKSAKIQEVLGSDVLFVRGIDKGGGSIAINIGKVTDEEKKKLRQLAESLGDWTDAELDAIIP